MSAAADVVDDSTTATDTQGAGSGTESTGEDTSSRGYLERVSSDGDFAREQVRSHQSRADSLAAEKRKLEERVGDLSSYLELYDGNQLAASLGLVERMTADPDMMSVIQDFQAHGRVNLPAQRTEPNVDTSSDDEYRTPEEIKIAELESRLNETQGELTQIRGHNGRNALLEHLDRFYGEYDLEPGARKKLAEDLGKVVDTWKAQGKTGLAALNNLQDPSSYETVFRGLALGRVAPSDVVEAAQRAALRKTKGLAGLATDSPSGLASTGAEAPPEFKSANDAFAWAAAHSDQLGGSS